MAEACAFYAEIFCTCIYIFNPLLSIFYALKIVHAKGGTFFIVGLHRNKKFEFLGLQVRLQLIGGYIIPLLLEYIQGWHV
jgi:hypothetical protein